MILRPRFKAHFHIEVVEGEGVFLISEGGKSVLTGRLFERVAGLIDGRRTADDIATELEGEASLAEVYYALLLLERKGCVSESHAADALADAPFWTIQNVSPASALQRLSEVQVAVTAVGDVQVSPFLTILDSLRVRHAGSGDLSVVVTDDYLRTELEVYNTDASRTGRPWMLLKPIGSVGLIGPVFVPGRTGCWQCLAERIRINRAVERFLQRKQSRSTPFPIPNAATPAAPAVVFGMAATEIARWIVRGGSPLLEGHVLSIEMVSWRTGVHPLTRQPLCTSCGDPQVSREQDPPPIELSSRIKTLTTDGGHRAIAPEETLRRYERQVSPITGAVSGLYRRTISGDGDMHVYVAGDNLGSPIHDLKHLQRTLRSNSSGKGITDVQARASALCEALERYSGVFRGTEPRRRASLKKLDGAAIHPNECMRFSDRQYQDRQAINARGLPFYQVPVVFDEAADIEWSPVWSLTHRLHRYLPTAYCYYDYPARDGERYCVACSNGNAAGNTMEEAILQGALELIERDSAAVWWYNRIRRPPVDLAAFDEPYLEKAIRFLAARQRELWVLDLTSDVGIPVCAALSRRIAGAAEHILIGFGAHLERRTAVLRAVTELIQTLTWVLPSDRGGVEHLEAIEDSHTLEWLRSATTAGQPHLAADSQAPRAAVLDYAARRTTDLKDDVLLCRTLLERHGLEMLVLDQTRPDIGLPVVKVIVPGLRHFWARFAPGRLYDVPVRLGWLSRPAAESELNPIPMFV